MKLKITGVLVALIVLVGSAVAFAQGGASTQKTAPAAKPPAAGAYDKALLTPAALNAKAPETYDVKFSTTVGDFVIHVTRAWAPLGADRFYNLVKHHFYDNVGFYRAIPGFMAQFGIGAIPEVDRVWNHSDFKDDPVRHSNTRGTITFATAGANTRTTQLFINFVNNAGLDPQGFAPFGEVTSGMDIVDKINTSYQNLDPQKISDGGKAYLEKNYPNLTFIKTATLMDAAPATPKP